MAIMNFGLPGRKEDGHVFPTEHVLVDTRGFQKRDHDVRFLLALMMGSSTNSLNLTLQIFLEDLGLTVRIK